MTLKREDILAGRIEQQITEAERLGLMTRLPKDQREASKQAILSAVGDDELWVFGYGSLMWNPCIHYIDRQPATIYGYHRSYCLETFTGRGSREHPGLMLALQPRGSCRGFAYHIASQQAEPELDIIWNREMVSGAYIPRILNMHTPIGMRRAVTFVINNQHIRYRAQISLQESAAMIAVAEGWLGSCADYLFNTVTHLDELGIRDGVMHRLQDLVRQQQKKSIKQ